MDRLVIMVINRSLHIRSHQLFDRFPINIGRAFDSDLCISDPYVCKNHLQVEKWIDKKIWDIQDSLDKYNHLFVNKKKGSFDLNGKNFNWQIDYSLIAASETLDLYSLRLKVNWHEGKRRINLVRETYLKGVKEKEK